MIHLSKNFYKNLLASKAKNFIRISLLKFIKEKTT